MTSSDEFTVESQSPADTRRAGAVLGSLIEPGMCVALVGALGAGKTEFVKGLAVGAGVPSATTVNSPTFVIVNEYSGRLHLYHIDAYRLGGVEEFAALGFGEMIASGGAVIVEWADRAAEVLPEDRLAVRIDHVGASERRLVFRAFGDDPSRVLRAFVESA